jgi:MerR family mercuric resistance operon transcriptional regulator
MSEDLTVAGLAGRAGVSPAAVRYDERLGLVSPAARSAAGYRRYDEDVVQRLRFVKGPAGRAAAARDRRAAAGR